MQGRQQDNPIQIAIARVLDVTGQKIGVLAALAGLQETTARRVAAGKISPTIRTVEKLGRACGMSAGEFTIFGELDESVFQALATKMKGAKNAKGFV